MSEVNTITLSHKELVEVLIKHQRLHEGIWQLYIEFGISAVNMLFGDDQASPAAVVPINKIGLHRAEKETPLGLDASKVNPAPKPKKKTKS